MERHTVQVFFSNGDSLMTEINGSVEEVRDYYRIGRLFNLGLGEYDLMAKVTELKFL